MRKNGTLLAGMLITFVMIAAALLGGAIAPHKTTDQVKIEYVVDESGKGSVISPPLAPGAEYPLGTDKYGYDLMTLLLDGAKYTIFLSFGIAIARVAIGGTVGMLLGYYGKKPAKRKRTGSVWSVLNGIPVFLIAWLTLAGISINPAMTPLPLALLMGIVLTAVGLPSVVSAVKEKTQVVKDKPFVMAAQALGSGDGKIIRTHLFPHLKESFLILIVQEIILVLTLFGQLAIFNLFVGGTTMYMDPPEYHSRTNEWGGLIGQARGSLYLHQWILFLPLAVYVSLIMGFHLVSNGLEKLYNRRYAKYSHF